MSRLEGIPRTDRGRGSGFSLFELVVVIALISVLLTAALTRLWSLQVDAERVAMEQVIGSLRSAIGIDVASHLVDGDIAGLRSLEGSNPMDRLAQVPKNYRGTLNGMSLADLEGGAWYFDTQGKTLVYRVRNGDYFRGGIGQPARVRFAVRLVYETHGRRGPGGEYRSEISGATLLALDSYEWIYRD